MISRHDYRGGVWIDLEQPTEEEIQGVVKEFSIGPLIARELFSPTPSPLVAADAEATLLVLHFPAHGAEDGTTESQEVDFVVGDRFIVTVRYEVVASLYHLQKLFETQEIISGHETITTDVLIEVLFAHLYSAVRDHTDHVAANLARVEKDMFDGHERRTVRLISGISREFLHMEAALANQEESLGHFLRTLLDRGSFGAIFAERADRIRAERAQIAQLVKTHRAIATEMRETNIALLEVRQNEIMKTLTVITFGVMPLELIVLIFGMHMPGTPLEQNPNAFWIIMASLLVIASGMMLFFSRKRWLS